MQNEKITLPLDIYYEHLTQINGVEFTPREIDVISCILNRRATSISAFLLIGQRAIETYNRNIRQKAGGLVGREQIIDFIEKSDKFSIIKNEYYFSLRLRVLFEEKLKAISKKFNIKSSCLIAYEKGQKYNPSLIPSVKEHLKYVGFVVKTYPCKREEFFTHPNEILNLEQINHALYIFPQGLYETLFSQINKSHLSNIIFLFYYENIQEDVYKNLKNNNYINMLEKENYYLSFFEILKKLLPHSNLENIVEELKQQYGGLINESFEVESLQENLNTQKELPFPLARESFVKQRKWGFLVGLILAVSLLNLGFFMIRGEKGKRIAFVQSTACQKKLESTIRSDLILPTHSILLNRPELMDQINNKFKGQGGIQTVALVGIGGSGKTTTARHNAHQQKANVVWEINAGTKENLVESFEKLAQSLSQSEGDQKLLRGLQEIKNSTEREEKLVRFVKEHLKLQKPWFLIYDNVENFMDIQKYFPQDSNTWGEGKIILTTRNTNIQNNSQIDGAILIGELAPNQKLSLFMQIINHGEKRELTTTQQNEAMEFLKQLPPFPLDISVAAYYLKTMNIAYDKYLEYLSQQNKDFTLSQENLLKEAGEYTKTRYSIITLSLKNLMEKHKDFTDLLLFISLLDSQNIPRDLLDAYVTSTVVDNFIHHLKKHSLIIMQSSVSSTEPTLIIHRSTQAIILVYLTNLLNLEKNKHYMEHVGTTFGNYLIEAIDNECFQKNNSLVRHCEMFLSHSKLLNSIFIASIGAELGNIYREQGNYEKAKQLFERSIVIYEKNSNKTHPWFSRALAGLGNAYREQGHYEKAKQFLGKSLEMYRNNSYENHPWFARTLGWMGSVYREQGSYEKAILSLEKSIVIYRKNSYENHPWFSQTLGRLGSIYVDIGNYEKAKQLYEESLKIYRKNSYENHPWFARTMVWLGSVYADLGHYEKGKKLLEESLKIYRKNSYENHPWFARTLARLGSVYADLGHYEKGKKLFEESLVIYRKNSYENHPWFSWTLAQLGSVYREQGDYEKAKKLLEESLKIYKKNSYENHPWFVDTLAELGSVYAVLQNYKKAKSNLKKSLHFYENQFGKDHVRKALLLRDLGEVYLLEGNLKIAEDFFCAALGITQKNKHSSVHKCLESFSNLNLKKSEKSMHKKDMEDAQNFKNQAINNLKQAVEIVKSHYPEDSPHIIRIQLKLKELEQGKSGNKCVDLKFPIPAASQRGITRIFSSDRPA